MKCAAGPRPGFSLVVFEPAAMLMTRVIPCEDAHAQERSLTAELLALVKPGDGDREMHILTNLPSC